MFLWTLFVYSVQYLGGITLNITLFPTVQNKKTRLKRRAFRFICHLAHFVLLKRTFGFGDYTCGLDTS